MFQDQVPGAAGRPHRTIGDAGHFVQEERGEELAQIIADFIETSTPETVTVTTARKSMISGRARRSWTKKAWPPS